MLHRAARVTGKGAKPVLVAGARTPIGRIGGALSESPAVELGAMAIRAALERAGNLSPDYVALGNILQAANGQNPARQAAVRAGVSREVPAITLNDVCLASMSAVALAANMTVLGEASSVVVGGFESMSQAPHAVRLRGQSGTGDVPMVDVMTRDGLWCALDDVGMGVISDRQNERFGLGRDEQDRFSLESHRRAARATDDGRLASEIAPVSDDRSPRDEGIRPDARLEALARLPPAFAPEGTITAGNASQLADAGAAGVVTTMARASAEGLHPLVEIAGRVVVAGPDSGLHDKPARAAEKLLHAHGLKTGNIGLWEINEAFAGVVLATMARLELDPEVVNVNGGAVALGHPLGASGFRLVLTLAHEMQLRDVEWGVAAICGGGGQGAAVLLRAVEER